VRAKAWQGSYGGMANPEIWKAGLAILETMANLLEAGEAVKMNDPPSVRLLELQDQGPDSLAAVSDRMADWAAILYPYVKNPA